MNRYRQILTVLTGSDADQAALRWTALIARAAGTERVEVLILDPEPADLVPEYPPVKGYEPWKDRVRETAEEVAEAFEGLPGLAVHSKTAVGSLVPTILQELVDSRCDLVVLGVSDENDRRLAEKLARKSPASVLSVPGSSRAECRSILVPIDFSEPSALALEIAEAFGRTFQSARIACLHSYRISVRPGTPGVVMDSIKEGHQESATNHLANFLDRHGSPSLPLEHLVHAAQIPSTAILKELGTRPYDLIVMATRGRSSMARALLGSNTAEVLRAAAVPVLAAKAKGEGLPFLRALLDNQEHRHSTSADPA